MANLKNITELPVAESAEGLNLIVNDGGSAKQIAASKLSEEMVTSWNDLTDKPFYTEIKTYTILENQECTSDAPNMVTVDKGILINDVVKVIYNGDTYELTPNLVDVLGVYVGNISLIGDGDDTGEPFFIAPTENSKLGIVCAETATVSIYTSNEVFHPLNAEHQHDFIIRRTFDYKNATGSVPIETMQVLGFDYECVKKKFLAGRFVSACVHQYIVQEDGCESWATCIPEISLENDIGGFGEYIHIEYMLLGNEYGFFIYKSGLIN